MVVEKYINTIFKSNSYILNIKDEPGIWALDPGDSEPILRWLEINNKYLKGILITHSHFDHIYGINDLYDAFPDILIYASEYARDGMFSSKLNRSYYTDFPYEVKCKNVKVVSEPAKITIAENISADVIDTPGHNNDCLSFAVGKYLFTGDALMPGIKIYTKSKNGNKAQAIETILRIVNRYDRETIICPGHGDICNLGEIELSALFGR